LDIHEHGGPTAEYKEAGQRHFFTDTELETVKISIFGQLDDMGEAWREAYSVKRWEKNPKIIFFNKHRGLSRICINTGVEHSVKDHSFMAMVDDRSGVLLTKCRKCPEAWKPIRHMPSDLVLDLRRWTGKVSKIVTYDADHMKPLADCIDSRVTLQMGSMGVGKTFAVDTFFANQDLLRQLVNKYTKFNLGPTDPVRCMIGPTSRESLANSAFDNYPSIKDQLTFYNNVNHVPGRYYAIEYESLHTLLGFNQGCFGYHVIHADELESIWVTMTSQTTNRTNLTRNKTVFTAMLQECLVIGSEALPTTRTLDMLTKICDKNEISIYQNTCVKNPKKITLSMLDVSGEVMDDSFGWRMINETANGNRQVLVSGSLGYLKSFENALMTKYPTMNAKFYEGHSSAQKKAEVRDPDLNWRVQFLGYTGVFTVGISDNVRDWFAEVNMLVTQTGGSLVRDLFQG